MPFELGELELPIWELDITVDKLLAIDVSQIVLELVMTGTQKIDVEKLSVTPCEVEFESP